MTIEIMITQLRKRLASVRQRIAAHDCGAQCIEQPIGESRALLDEGLFLAGLIEQVECEAVSA